MIELPFIHCVVVYLYLVNYGRLRPEELKGAIPSFLTVRINPLLYYCCADDHLGLC